MKIINHRFITWPLALLLLAINVTAQRPELVVQSGHASEVRTVAFSPDGKLLASGSGAGTFEFTEVNLIKLWDVATGTELRSFVPDGYVAWIAFSNDGRRMAALGKKLKVWDVATGAELSDDAGEWAATRAVSADGKLIAEFNAMSNTPAVVRLRDAATGRELHALTHKDRFVIAAAFSPDGRKLRTFTDKDDYYWDVATGASLDEDKSYVEYASRAITADMRLRAEADGPNVHLRDAATGREVRALLSRTSDFQKVLFSPDSTTLATGGNRHSIRLWDLRSGVLRTLVGHTDYPVSAAFSPDSRLFASGGRDLVVRVWDVLSGRELKALTGHKDQYVNALLFNADGRRLLSFDKKGGKLWDVETGRELASIPQIYDQDYLTAAFDPQGRLLAVSLKGGVQLYSTETGQAQQLLPSEADFAHVAFSPDGKTLAVRDFAQLELWDVAAAKRLFARSAPVKQDDVLPEDMFIAAAFSPDAKTMAAVQQNELKSEWKLYLIETATGRLLQTINKPAPAQLGGRAFPKYGSVVFSADGRQVLNIGSENALGWDVETGQLARAFDPQEGDNAAQFRRLWALAPQYYSQTYYNQHSPDGRYFVDFGLNGELRLRATRDWHELIALVGIDEHDWLAVTPEGFFDGSPAAWRQLLWRFDNNTFNYTPVELFFNEFYYPGLLQDVLAGKSPQPPEGRELARIDRRQPKVTLTQADDKGADKRNAMPDAPYAKRTTTVVVDIVESADRPAQTDQPATSGARDARLFRNGSLVKVWRGDVFAAGAQDGCALVSARAALEPKRVRCRVNVPVVAGANEFTAYAFNHDNVKSADAQLNINGAESLRRPATLRLLAVGVNRYANERFDLRFAVADAQSFAAEVKLEQERLRNFARVEVAMLTDAQATKRNILAALAELARTTQPEDTVIVYFAGHGLAQQNQFYLIPHDLGYTGERRQIEPAAMQALLAHSVSDRELERAFERVAADQFVLVIDACNSGQALEAEEKRRGPMNSKGLAQLAYEKGMYVLTAAESFQAAQEVSKLGHGLLTYVLVEEGLKQKAADTEPKDGNVVLREWLDYATRRVPEMQVQEMQRAVARGSDLAFADEERTLDLPKRAGQRPRVFYRRESEQKSLVVARP